MRKRPVASTHDPSSLHPVSLWRRLARPGDLIRSSRCVYLANDEYQLHSHDYAECCWVTHGSIWLTEPHTETLLETGDLCLIHADYRHGFRVPAAGSCSLVNIALPSKTIAAFATRYDDWQWGDAKHPVRKRLNPIVLSSLDQWPERIEQNRQNQLLRDACLLAIQASITAQATPALPSWLQEALLSFQHEPHLAAGAPALVALSGKSREHCSRVVKEKLGITLRELVNTHRVTTFAGLLVTTDRPIKELTKKVYNGAPAALYRIFKKQYHMTPRQWRQQRRG